MANIPELAPGERFYVLKWFQGQTDGEKSRYQIVGNSGGFSNWDMALFAIRDQACFDEMDADAIYLVAKRRLDLVLVENPAGPPPEVFETVAQINTVKRSSTILKMGDEVLDPKF